MHVVAYKEIIRQEKFNSMHINLLKTVSKVESSVKV